jgi:hypothetical protein
MIVRAFAAIVVTEAVTETTFTRVILAGAERDRVRNRNRRFIVPS